MTHWKVIKVITNTIMSACECRIRIYVLCKRFCEYDVFKTSAEPYKEGWWWISELWPVVHSPLVKSTWPVRYSHVAINGCTSLLKHIGFSGKWIWVILFFLNKCKIIHPSLKFIPQDEEFRITEVSFRVASLKMKPSFFLRHLAQPTQCLVAGSHLTLGCHQSSSLSRALP